MKYKLTSKTKIHRGVTLYQIEALKDFGDVKKGQLGGFVQSEQNLSQKGNCWVFTKAIVRDNACVCDHAVIGGDSIVKDNAIVNGYSVVDDSHISDYACISGRAVVTGYTGYNEIGIRELVNGTTRLNKENAHATIRQKV